MLTARHAYPLFPDYGYTHELHPRLHLLSTRNSLAPKNSYHCSSCADRGRSEQCKWHSFLSYSRSLGIRHTSEEWQPTYVHDPAADDPPKSCSLCDEQGHETLLQAVAEDYRTWPSVDISVSKLHDTCNPTSSGLNFVCCS